MSNERRLIIDVGTNSVLALLADVHENNLKVISDFKKTTRLGEALLKNNSLSQSAIKRTIDAIANFVKAIDYDSVYILGTEALRAADNSNDFSALLYSRLGLKLTVLSGLKEAELSFLGATYNLKIETDKIIHVDVGGGSTEIIRSTNSIIDSAISIPIGALKLYEMIPDAGIAEFCRTSESIIRQKIALGEFEIKSELLATGGTITSAAAIAGRMKDYNASEIHGMRLNLTSIDEIASNFENAPDKKQLIPFDPDRADLILPGLGIYMALMSIICKGSLIVSTGGVRYGAALYPDKIRA